MITKGNSRARLTDDMDPGMLAFLREKVNTFVKWDLVRFFHDNPHAALTAEHIARYTGRDIHSIAGELVELVEAGVLEQNQVSGQNIFALTADRAMRGIINDFVRACDDRVFRVKAIYHVIQAMR